MLGPGSTLTSWNDGRALLKQLKLPVRLQSYNVEFPYVEGDWKCAILSYKDLCLKHNKK
jgi:hypothetical protein